VGTRKRATPETVQSFLDEWAPAVTEQLSTERYARLEKILNVLLLQEKFTLAQLKAKLAQEKPAFVTRLVRQLEREGHLRTGEDGTICWALAPGSFPASYRNEEASTVTPCVEWLPQGRPVPRSSAPRATRQSFISARFSLGST
jgi:hypothetical protein